MKIGKKSEHENYVRSFEVVLKNQRKGRGTVESFFSSPLELAWLINTKAQMEANRKNIGKRDMRPREIELGRHLLNMKESSYS